MSIKWPEEIAENTEMYWALDEVKDPENAIPSMIVKVYSELYMLFQENNVYGILLGMRDVYEILMKVSVVAALASIDYEALKQGLNKERAQDSKDEREFSRQCELLLNAFLLKPLCIGSWSNLAYHIEKAGPRLRVPGPLCRILQINKCLFDQSGIANWRNEVVAHGMLRLKDDEGYQKDFKKYLLFLKDYFTGTKKYSLKGAYRNLRFVQGGRELLGGEMPDPDAGELWVKVAGREIDMAQFWCRFSGDGQAADLWGFFDSFYSKLSTTKYVSYVSGRQEQKCETFFADLYSSMAHNGTGISLEKDFLYQKELDALKQLNQPEDYIVPEFLIEWLQDQIKARDQGIFTICMKRGCGKTALAYQLDGSVFEPMLDDVCARTIHISGIRIGGQKAFRNLLESVFLRDREGTLAAYNTDPPRITDRDSFCREIARIRDFWCENGYEYLLLVIDGIDEIDEELSPVLEMIPDSQALPERCYILMLTRFPDEDKFVAAAKRDRIRKVLQRSDEVKEVSSDEVDDLLRKYITDKAGAKKGEDPDDLAGRVIEWANHRFLYAKVLLPMIKADRTLDTASPNAVISSFLATLRNGRSSWQTNRLMHIAGAIALLPGLSLREYGEFVRGEEITLETVGCFNDLMPLLTSWNRNDSDNSSRNFEYANEEYAAYIWKSCSDSVKEVSKDYIKNLTNLFHKMEEEFSEQIEYNAEMHRRNDSVIAFYVRTLPTVIGGILKTDRSCLDMAKLLRLLFDFTIFADHGDNRDRTLPVDIEKWSDMLITLSEEILEMEESPRQRGCFDDRDIGAILNYSDHCMEFREKLRAAICRDPSAAEFWFGLLSNCPRKKSDGGYDPERREWVEFRKDLRAMADAGVLEACCDWYVQEMSSYYLHAEFLLSAMEFIPERSKKIRLYSAVYEHCIEFYMELTDQANHQSLIKRMSEYQIRPEEAGIPETLPSLEKIKEEILKEIRQLEEWLARDCSTDPPVQTIWDLQRRVCISQNTGFLSAMESIYRTSLTLLVKAAQESDIRKFRKLTDMLTPDPDKEIIRNLQELANGSDQEYVRMIRPVLKVLTEQYASLGVFEKELCRQLIVESAQRCRRINWEYSLELYRYYFSFFDTEKLKNISLQSSLERISYQHEKISSLKPDTLLPSAIEQEFIDLCMEHGMQEEAENQLHRIMDDVARESETLTCAPEIGHSVRNLIREFEKKYIQTGAAEHIHRTLMMYAERTEQICNEMLLDTKPFSFRELEMYLIDLFSYYYNEGMFLKALETAEDFHVKISLQMGNLNPEEMERLKEKNRILRDFTEFFREKEKGAASEDYRSYAAIHDPETNLLYKPFWAAKEFIKEMSGFLSRHSG